MAEIGALIVRMSADVASLQSDLGRANAIAQRSADQMASTFKTAGDVVKQFAAGLAAAFTIDKIVEVGKAAIDLGDNLNKMSQKIGISVENLSALRNAAQLSDVGFEELGSATAKFARTMTEAASGSKEQAASFKAIGVSVKDANGNIRGTSDVLTDVAKKFAMYEDSASKTALAQRLFGKSGAELVPLLNQLGRDGFEAVTKAADKYNQVIGAEQAAQSEQFNDNLTRLTMAGSGLANAIVKELLPALVRYSGDMAEAVSTTDGYADSASVFVNAAKAVALAATVAKETIAALVKLLVALGDTLGAVGDVFNSWGTAVVHDLTAVGEAMRGNFAAAKVAMDAAGESVTEGWTAASTRIKVAWKTAADSSDDAVAKMSKAYDDLFGTFSNVSSGAQTTAGAIDLVKAPIVATGDAAKDTSRALEELAKAQKSAMDMLDSLRGKTDQTAAAQAEFDKGTRELQARMEAWAIAGGDVTQVLAAWQEGEELLTAELDKKNRAIAKAGDILGNYLAELNNATALDKMTAREKAIAQAVQKVTEEWNKNSTAGGKNKQMLAELTEAVRQAAGAAFDAQKVQDFVAQFGDVTPFEKMKEGIEEVGKALEEALGEGATGRIEELQRTLGKMRQSMVDGIITTSQDGLRSIQSMTEEGSKAFRAMQIAIDALTVVQAIAAVLNQGQGDPYTAFARMAAMAAAVVALGVDIANFGGGGGPSADSAEVRQRVQGTGTVLGDPEAKSESIAKAIEITANATSQLVGLNRGMLDALRSVQRALGEAGNLLARGAGDVQFAGATDGFNLLDPFGQDPLGGAIGSFLFGGSQEVIDQGIQIAGGTLQEMLNSIVVGAYQTIETDGGLFGSDETNDQFSAISDAFATQFQLVIRSIADAVEQGALALGLLPDDIKAAMDQFQVAATKISLEGLSAEDQQAALEAVFSSIFDGLAAAVVPFIDQFQQVGEGLGETLVRVATEVQVTQEAFKQLGLSVATTDPEKFAQIADGLVQAAGGIDAFITGMQSFVANFSDASHQFSVNVEALSSAFSQVGLSVPSTREGLFDLMQTLDATTEEGREQIATLLRLSEVANTYYQQLEEFTEVLGLAGKSDFTREMESIRDSAIGLIKALQAAGASSDTLQSIYDASVKKMQALIDQLRASAQSLAFSLGLTNVGNLDEVNAEIARLQQQAGQGATAVADFGSAMTEAATRASDAINLLIGDLSPLNDRQKLEEARKGLMAGQVSQEAFLTIAQRLFASSAQYEQEFAFAQRFGASPAANGIRNPNPSSGGLSGSDSERLRALLAQQQQLQAAAQLTQYQTLAEQIAEIATAQGLDFTEVLASMQISMQGLEEGLGLADDNALRTFIEAIQARDAQDGNGTAVLADLLTQIRDLLSSEGRGENDPTQGNQGRGIPTADEIGEAVAVAINRPSIGERRSARGLPA